MAERKIPARDIIVQVQAADNVTWLGIGGLNSVKVNPGAQEKATDTTTYDSAGQYEEVKLQRGASMKLDGLMLKDNLTGVQNAGQLRCEVLGGSAAVGYASLGAVRFRHPADAVWRVWAQATFSLAEQGGGNNDVTTWSVTVMRSGATTTVTAP